MRFESSSVTFGLNIMLNLSEVAVTEAFGTLLTQLLLEVLSESTWL